MPVIEKSDNNAGGKISIRLPSELQLTSS